MDKKANRFGYSEALNQMLTEGKDIVVLDADLAKSTTTAIVKDKHPDKFIDVGIAEQNLVGIAAGISLNGTVPFACTYAAFLTGRAFDQIRTTVSYSNLNVKLAGMHTGITVGADGPTHQMLEDIALMRVLPNMKIINPCDYLQAIKATKAAYEIDGPVYIRFIREATPIFTMEKDKFIFGKADELRQGNDAVIISSGPLIYNVLQAADELIDEGFSIRVLNIHTLKPVDEDEIVRSAKETGKILVVDEHQKFGGLGTIISEVLVKNELSVKYRQISVDDMFLTSGKPEELIDYTGFSVQKIKEKMNEML